MSNLTQRLALMLFLLVSASSLNASQQPNVIVIITDDQGWGDLSCHGNTNLSTPSVDRLASEGVAFDRFYVQPVCSPTRAELLTGLYHPRLEVTGVSRGAERMRLGVATLANHFQQAGYETAAFGKWHNGTQAPYHPLCRGFDEFYGFCSGHWGHYFSPLLDHNGKLTKGKGYLIDDFTDHAIEFIERHQKRPFMTLLAYNTPHSPMQVPDRWWQKHREQKLRLTGTNAARENLPHTRAALAMCENIDWNVGRLLDAITKRGLDENTIVVYMSDNGPNGHRWNGGMRGIKGSTDEGGVRSPLFVRWPSRLPAGRKVTTNAAVTDILPTLCDLAGIEAPQVDGLSLKPLLIGSDANWPDRLLFSHWNGRTAVRRGSFVLDNRGRLYDLANDPAQQVDIASQQPDTTEELKLAADRWRREVFPDSTFGIRPTSIGHPSLDVTQLPARDAVSEGEIKRSNRYPNSSYFTNWKSKDDAIVWNNVQVDEPGRFRVNVFYNCDPGNEGSVVELKLADSSIRATVEQSHPRRLVGEEQDRVRRQESYEQEWSVLNMGTIDLPKSTEPQNLTLKAKTIAAEQVMDFRLLTLERMGPNQTEKGAPSP